MSVQFTAKKESDTKNFVKFTCKNGEAIITVYVRPQLGFDGSKPLNVTLSQEGGA
jgi:hypothetical protein